MNTKTSPNNFNLSQSFSWFPPFYDQATDLGLFLRQKHATSQMSDSTTKLKRGDIYVLSPGNNFSTKDLLLLVKEKDPAVVVADLSDKTIIEGWYEKNIDSCNGKWRDTYFLKSLKNLSGFLASSFYFNPSSKVKISAVTGTNGKTTVVNSAAKAFASCNGACASLGTLGLIIYKKVFGSIKEFKVMDFGLTTPSAVFLQRSLSYILTQGVKEIFVEASSIGLVKGRFLGCKIKNAVLTNISDDHLDFHGSFEELRLSKSLLFTIPNLEKAIFVNSNETYIQIYKKIVDKIDKKIRVFFVGAGNKTIKSSIFLKINSTTMHGTNVSFEHNSQFIDRFTIPTIGKHNIENASVVAGLLLADGKHYEKIITALKNFKPPTGRMNFLEEKNCPLVCIDYAHTPDAFKQTLSSLRVLSNDSGGKLLCVFGCGGDRDNSKRKIMGEIASEYCDSGCITSDNPRSENVKNINEQIMEGIRKNSKSKWLQLENRSEGIKQVISNANINDVVLIAGKGHEDFQIIGTRKILLNDFSEVKKALQNRKFQFEKL